MECCGTVHQIWKTPQGLQSKEERQELLDPRAAPGFSVTTQDAGSSGSKTLEIPEEINWLQTCRCCLSATEALHWEGKGSICFCLAFATHTWTFLLLRACFCVYNWCQPFVGNQRGELGKCPTPRCPSFLPSIWAISRPFEQ